MSLIITLLTIVLVVVCLMLILLILIQLPKKEAGLGQAFGGQTTDALFGAGSGNVLTKLTKYAAGAFFVLALLLTILNSHSNIAKKRTRALEEGLSQRPGATKQLLPPTTPAVSTNSGLLKATTGTNALSLTAPAATNAAGTKP